jgi:hypothetical protein
MQINITDEGAMIDMTFYAKQFLEGVKVPERHSSEFSIYEGTGGYRAYSSNLGYLKGT